MKFEDDDMEEQISDATVMLGVIAFVGFLFVLLIFSGTAFAGVAP